MNAFHTVIFLVIGVSSIAESSCPDGWIRHHDVCYLISHDAESMPIAAELCKHMGGHIVELNSISENAFISSEAKLYRQNFWIGLNDIQEEGIWKWYDSNRKLNTTGFTGWASDQPDNGDGRENCVYIDSNHGTWHDSSCSNNFHYFCEKTDAPVSIVG